MKIIYPAVFYPFSDGSGGYTVEFPDLPGCITEGRNLEEAFENWQQCCKRLDTRRTGRG